MFEPIISENTARTRRPLAVALSFSGQVLLVTLAVVAPLLHTETIAPGHLLRVISAPRRLGPVRVFTERPPAGVYHQRPGLRVFTDQGVGGSPADFAPMPARFRGTVCLLRFLSEMRHQMLLLLGREHLGTLDNVL